MIMVAAGMLAGKLVEITDLRGQRVMAMFSSDNRFVFEHTNPNIPIVPLLLRDMDEPVVLGSLSEFVKANNLFQALIKVESYVDVHYSDRVSDTLLLCRVLKFLHKDSCHINPTEEMIQKAMTKVFEEERELLAIHDLMWQIEVMATKGEYCE